MVDAFRAQLDELMGKDRNLLPHEKKGRGQHFSDPDICKNYICGFCPSELFTNTKSDLGPCNKVHDDQCREQYLAEKNKGEYPFEADWIHYLERLIQDLDKKIKKAHDRLDTQDSLSLHKIYESVDLRTYQYVLNGLVLVPCFSLLK